MNKTCEKKVNKKILLFFALNCQVFADIIGDYQSSLGHIWETGWGKPVSVGFWHTQKHYQGRG